MPQIIPIAEMSVLIIYTKCPRIYSLLKKYLHWYIRRDGSRKIFVRCSANVLRPNTGGGKQKPASSAGRGANNFRSHKKTSSRASGDDFKEVYRHKN